MMAELGTSLAVVWRLVFAIGAFGVLTSTIFLAMVFIAARRFRRQDLPQAKGPLPPVSILKPLHGLEPRLEQNLESFFRQDYPAFELIFGMRSDADPALAVVERLRRRYPQVPAKVIFSGHPTWPNAKVYSLDRMLLAAGHEYLVISDSDVEVERDFLAAVIPPLLEPTTGLVTCLYRGVPAPEFWSGIEAIGMSVEMPSGVLVANMLEGMKFALGPAVATRKACLHAIGGIGATADYYSDDFVLGNLIADAGYRVVLSHKIVGHVLVTQSLRTTSRSQLRWMKSTRFSRPLGHIGTGLTFGTPFGLLALLSAAAMGHAPLGAALFAVTALGRMAQSLVIGWGLIRDPRALRQPWLFVLRDLVGFCLWLGSFTGRRFEWRGETYQFGPGGRITALQRPMSREKHSAAKPSAS
jgi:ceramide glucosyltransferase